MRYTPTKGRLTYNYARALLDHARDRAAGKPLSNKWSRLYDHPTEKDAVLLRYCGNDLAIIRPNDDVVMLSNPKYAQGTYAAFGIWCWRARKDYYRVGVRGVHGVATRPNGYWSEGMTINMRTGVASGPTKPPYVAPVRDPERGKAWTKKVTEYNRLWRVTAKLGEIERIIRETWESRHSLGRMPSAERIAQIIETGDVSPQAVRHILFSRLWDNSWRSSEDHYYREILRGRSYNNETTPEMLFSIVYASWRKQVQKAKGLY